MKKSILFTTAFVAITAVSIFSWSCKKDTTTTTPAGPSVYTQLGGTTLVADPSNPGTTVEKGYLAIRSVVDSAIFVIAGDTQLTPYFAVLLAEVGSGNLTGFNALSTNLSDFIAANTGSTNPNYAYGGKSMKDAHNPATNPRISKTVDPADFSKFVGDVGTGLAQNGVTSANNPTLVNELVNLLDSQMGTVVQRSN